MFNFKERPYYLLLVTAIILVIAGIFNFNYPMYIYVSNPYIFPLPILRWLPLFLLNLFWILYSLTYCFLISKTMTWIHIILTALLSLFILTIPYLSLYLWEEAGAPRRYFDYLDLKSFMLYDNPTKAIIISFSILLLGQFIYFLNLIIGLYTRSLPRINNQ
jgi:hypothetical protein